MNTGFSNLDTLKKHLLANSEKNSVRFDAVITALGLGVAGQFANLTSRKFARLENATEIFPADRCEFVLSRVPLESVSQAEIKNTEAEGWVVQTDPNFIRAINLADGIINTGPGDAGPYYAQVRFTFTGGFFWETLEPDDANFPSTVPDGAALVPDDLFKIWLLQCRHIWGLMDKLGVDLLKDGAEKSLRFPQDYAPTVNESLGQFIRYKLI